MDGRCAFDPMEVVSGALPPWHAVRRDLDEYLRQRYRSVGPLASVPLEAQGAFRAALSTLAELARGILAAPAVYLFNEHFVVKPPRSAVAFAWHTDAQEQLAGHVHAEEYLSMWVALDDISAHNGGLLVRPWRDEGDVRAAGDDAEPSPDVVCKVASRDAVAFGSTVWHSSTPNGSHSPRRVFYCQFSRAPLHGRHSAYPLCFAVPMPVPTKYVII